MKKKTGVLLTAVLLTATVLSADAFAQSEESGTLTVQAVGFQNSSGLACVCVYNNADSFPEKGKAFKKSCGKIKDNKAFFKFKNLPLGDYAVYGFHDEDGNRSLKTNFVGMPKEAVGVSRGAKGFMGPPKFKNAKFAVAGKKSIRIKIAKL
ncbi:MAG: DUF2141 domain-containing protein [Deltaproteobacteria bacterium]|nr:DUF2141 domain-containing protein [Deltaproteobacteria bacterium]